MHYLWLMPHLILDVGEQNSGIWQIGYGQGGCPTVRRYPKTSSSGEAQAKYTHSASTASLYGDQASRVLTSADLHPECDLGKILYGLPVNSGAAFLPRSSQMHLYLPFLSSEPFLVIPTMRELFLSIPKPYPRALSGPWTPHTSKDFLPIRWAPSRTCFSILIMWMVGNF